METIKTLVANYKHERIYLWTGFAAAEIIHTARLLYHLQPQSNHVYLFDFTNFSMNNIHGEVVYPRSLVATDLLRVEHPEKHFRQLTAEGVVEIQETVEKN